MIGTREPKATKTRGTWKRLAARVGIPVAAAATLAIGCDMNAYAASMVYPFATSTPDWYCGHSARSNTVTLIFQCDGNLVLYSNSTGQALWATGSNGTGVDHVDFSAVNAEIDVKYSNGVIQCRVGAWNYYGHSLAVGGYADVQDDGNFVIYHAANQPVWASHTQYAKSSGTFNECN